MNIKEKYSKYKNTRPKLKFNIINKVNDTKCKIAIIIPYRDRKEHLKDFIKCIAKFRDNKYIDLYLIEQDNLDKFNRGLLLNIGFYLAEKKNYNYYIFHDVDSYPDEYLLNLYINCSIMNKVVHFASPHLEYKYTFHNFLGGIIGLNKDNFLKINGFPNNFFGWGGEDDAFYNRLATNRIRVYRPSQGHYILPEHNAPQNRDNLKKKNNILNDLKNWRKNGIKQIGSMDIEIEEVKSNKYNKYNKHNKVHIYHYKINYIAHHYDWRIINRFNKVNLDKFKNNKLIVHNRLPLYRAYIQPLIRWDEVERYIINTYIDPEEFEFKKKNGAIEKLISVQFKKYRGKRRKDDLINTLYYIFHHYGELLYFRIRNNKIVCEYYLYNSQYENDWYPYINFNKNEKIFSLLNKRHQPYITIENMKKWSNNGCNIFFEDWSRLEGNPKSYIRELKEMIEETISVYKNVPDCDILINRKDFQVLRVDERYSDYYMYPEKYDFKQKYDLSRSYPVASQSTTNEHLDINIPSADEWNALESKGVRCTDWNKKKSMAIFRGSSTGCGTTIETNQRLKLADLALHHTDVLDVKITKWVKQFKIDKMTRTVSFIDSHKYKDLYGNKLNSSEQSYYKYILNVAGNAQAYRLPNEFRKKSVILNVESPYYMWFEPLLKDDKNTIFIDKDFNNLFDKIDYLIKNDKKAKTIADNGYKFWSKYINKDVMCEYMFNYMKYANKICS